MPGRVARSPACDGCPKPRVAKGKVAGPKVETDAPHRRGRRLKSMQNASRPMRNATLADTRRGIGEQAGRRLVLLENVGERISSQPPSNPRRELREFRCVLLDLRGHGDSEHVSPPAYNPEHHAADLAQVVASLVHSPYAILAHSAGALAAARFITNTRASIPAAMLNAFVWVDLDPLVPRWQVDYFHQGVASVGRTFSTVDDALRGFRRIYPTIPEDRLRSFVVEGLRQVDGGWGMKVDPAP